MKRAKRKKSLEGSKGFFFVLGNTLEKNSSCSRNFFVKLCNQQSNKRLIGPGM